MAEAPTRLLAESATASSDGIAATYPSSVGAYPSSLRERIAAIREQVTAVIPADESPTATKRGWTSFFVSEHEELTFADAKYGQEAWPYRALVALHSLPVQLGGVLLLSADFLVIIIELIIELHVPSCDLVERDGVSCCAPALGAVGAPVGLCAAGLQAAGNAACDSDKWPVAAATRPVLLWTSIAIGFCFALELLLHLAILQERFLRNPLYVADACVVTTALTMEMILVSKKQYGHAALGALPILSRSWRFVRIGHALFSMKAKKARTQLAPLHGASATSTASSVKALLDVMEEEARRLEESAMDEAGGGSTSPAARSREAPATAAV